MGYGERMGTGIPRMIRGCLEKGYPEPEFREVEESFWVVLSGRKVG